MGEFKDRYYKQLEGFKIKKFLGIDAEGFPEFILTKPKYDDFKIAVSSDPEGNSGGFFFINSVEEISASDRTQ
jgi:hypothetical protein